MEARDHSPAKFKASRSPSPTISRKRRNVELKPPMKGNWHPDEDELITTMKTQTPPAKEADITTAVNALENSPGIRTMAAVRLRWYKTLKYDVVSGGGLTGDEEVQLLKAVKEVEGDKWVGVAAVFNKLSGRSLGKGAVKKLYSGLKPEGKK